VTFSATFLATGRQVTASELVDRQFVRNFCGMPSSSTSRTYSPFRLDERVPRLFTRVRSKVRTYDPRIFHYARQPFSRCRSTIDFSNTRWRTTGRALVLPLRELKEIEGRERNKRENKMPFGKIVAEMRDADEIRRIRFATRSRDRSCLCSLRLIQLSLMRTDITDINCTSLISLTLSLSLSLSLSRKTKERRVRWVRAVTINENFRYYLRLIFRASIANVTNCVT